MIIDCISDLHGELPELKGGDLLIVAGDLHARDEYKEHVEFAQWFKNLNYKKKIVIGGNHDNFLYHNIRKERTIVMPAMDCHYLCDSGTEIKIEEDVEEDHKFKGSITYKKKRKLKIWGSPWTARFNNQNPKCMAFSLRDDTELGEKWNKIPDDIDILVTHCPPYGILDYCSIGRVGSRSLFNKVRDSNIKLHVFGHIHENGGRIHELTRTEGLFQGSSVTFVNAALMNQFYKPVNEIVRIVL